MSETPTYIIAASGGQGAGKTTLGQTLYSVFSKVAETRKLTIADALRKECQTLHPEIPWFDRSQAAKDVFYPQLGKTMRQFLIDHGEFRVSQDKLCWVRTVSLGDARIGIVDDLRKLYELGYMRQTRGTTRFTHVHIDGGVPDYDCLALAEVADLRLPQYPCDAIQDWFQQLAYNLVLDEQLSYKIRTTEFTITT